MKGGRNAKGYTIVEVLIFMAVSGLMFVLSVVFVNGKQANVEFRQSLFEFNSEIRNVINEVSDGRFDGLSFGTNGTCSVSSPTVATSIPVFSTGPYKAQGTNGGKGGCIFFGKVIHVNVLGNPESAKHFNVYTVAARQMNKDDIPVTSFSEALPRPVVPQFGAPDLTRRKKVQAGSELTGAYLCSSNTCTVASPRVGQIGFFGSFNKAQGKLGSTSRLQSGAQSVVATVIPTSTTFGLDENTAVSQIADSADNINDGHKLVDGRYVLLCFRNGDKRGSITIGGPGGQQFSTEVKTNNLADACK